MAGETNTAFNRMSKDGRAYLDKYYPEDANGVRSVPSNVDVEQQRRDWEQITLADHEAILGQFGQAAPPPPGPSAPPADGGRSRRRRGKKGGKKTKKGGRRHKKGGRKTAKKMGCY